MSQGSRLTILEASNVESAGRGGDGVTDNVVKATQDGVDLVQGALDGSRSKLLVTGNSSSSGSASSGESGNDSSELHFGDGCFCKKSDSKGMTKWVCERENVECMQRNDRLCG